MSATMETRVVFIEQTKALAIGYAWAKATDGDLRLAEPDDVLWFADQVAATAVTWHEVRHLYDELAADRYAERRAAELAAELRS